MIIHNTETRKIPCAECPVYVMCKPRGYQTNGVSTLADECPRLHEFLTEKDDFHPELMYIAWKYFGGFKEYEISVRTMHNAGYVSWDTLYQKPI